MVKSTPNEASHAIESNGLSFFTFSEDLGRLIRAFIVGSYRPFKDPPWRIGSPPLPKSFFFTAPLFKTLRFEYRACV